MAPTELLRAGAVLQARGLVNSQAIQHNLDWVWPYWVERQFDPRDPAFVPRAFNITHINLTHRNWTAVGVPDSEELPIVDPRGLLTPFFDSWSIDVWLLPESGEPILPSRIASAKQELHLNGRLAVSTRFESGGAWLSLRADAVAEAGLFVSRLHLEGFSPSGGRLVVSVRPYNPEGVSFVNEITKLDDRDGWRVNAQHNVYFTSWPERQLFSSYSQGDVFSRLNEPGSSSSVRCDVGLASAAAIFRLEPGKARSVGVFVPVGQNVNLKLPEGFEPAPAVGWAEPLASAVRFEIPDEHFQFLYDAAIRTLVLHSPGDVYPGPYTYKRFWFRDAAFILHAMTCAGLADRVERTLDRFSSKQTPFGYFLSQEGEWDSNGEALWIYRVFGALTGRAPKPEWKGAILRAARWIVRKRLSSKPDSPHAGLLPAGFSAEHLGPNDYYYWDDFWGIAGLRAASQLAKQYGDASAAAEFAREAESFSAALEASLAKLPSVTAKGIVPASPHRRPDAGSIGSLAGGYPLSLWADDDPRLKATAVFLMERYFLDGGFFQEISHSGVNPYLSLHVAQVLLRAGDERFFGILEAIASMASPTGQWPEAVHPKTKGGCMGDGQHVWAAAEWVIMMRNLLVREEPGMLVIGSGFAEAWRRGGKRLSVQNAPTVFGPVSASVESNGGRCRVSWSARWREGAPLIEIRLPGLMPVRVEGSAGEISIGEAGA